MASVRRRPRSRPATAPLARPETWNRQALGWERWEPVLLHALAAVDPALLRRLELAPALRVIDFGCGTGDPSLAIARWVGPRGRVLGVDIAPGMLAVARRRARLLRLGNVRYRRADMARFRHDGARFHRAVSRFGLMFASDVGAALARMRASLAPGGRAALAVWGPAAANPTHFLRAEAVRPFLRTPEPDPELVPHPMRLGRPGLLPRLLRTAGFRDVEAEPVPVSFVYPGIDDYVRLQTETSLAELHGSLPAADRRRLERRLASRFRRFEERGVLRVPGLAFVASGRR